MRPAREEGGRDGDAGREEEREVPEDVVRKQQCLEVREAEHLLQPGEVEAEVEDAEGE